MEQTGLFSKKKDLGLPSSKETSYSFEQRSISQPAPHHSWLPKGRRRLALLWGIGSTGLSAIGLIILMLFEQYNGMVAEMRADLKHFNETSSEYVKKDRLQRCWERIRELSKEVNASKTAREQMDQELKASERAREDQAKENQRLRERLAYLEGMKAARPGSDPTPPAQRPSH